MSIKAMTWAFGLPLEPRAKIALLAIADNARDDGVAWPSKDTIAEKSSQSRATVQRRLKSLEALGVLACFARFREDGTQTSDEIRLNLAVTPEDVMRKMHDAGEANERETEEDRDNSEAPEPAPESVGGGCQADTLGSQSCNPTVAVVTGGGLHSGNPKDEPSLEPSKFPPNPPAGGSGPEDEIPEEVKKRFEYFRTACLGYRTQPPERPLRMFRLLDEAEQIACAAAAPLHAAECVKNKKKSVDMWKLIRDGFWKNYPEARMPEKPRPPAWIDHPGDIDALDVLALIAGRPLPRLIDDAERGKGLWRAKPLGRDLQALARFKGQEAEQWPVFSDITREFKAWRNRLHEWDGIWIESQKIWLEPFDPAVHGMSPSHRDFRMRKAVHGLRVPCRWPPNKDGTIYSDNSGEGESAA